MRRKLPTPGIPDEQALTMSRQARYQVRKKAEGMCPRCGKEPLAKVKKKKSDEEVTRTLCAGCLVRQRDAMRKRKTQATRDKVLSSA